MPNGVKFTGKVGPVETSTVNGAGLATVTVLIDPQNFRAGSGFILPGTPVSAIMALRNDDVLAALTAGVRTFVADVRTALAL